MMGFSFLSPEPLCCFLLKKVLPDWEIKETLYAREKVEKGQSKRKRQPG
jgi:hypothetical protein